MNGKSKLLFFCCILLFNKILISQTLITGVVNNIKNKQLEQVGVLLYQDDEILDYTFTDYNGFYTFTVKNNKHYIMTPSSM